MICNFQMELSTKVLCMQMLQSWRSVRTTLSQIGIIVSTYTTIDINLYRHLITLHTSWRILHCWIYILTYVFVLRATCNYFAAKCRVSNATLWERIPINVLISRLQNLSTKSASRNGISITGYTTFLRQIPAFKIAIIPVMVLKEN